MKRENLNGKSRPDAELSNGALVEFKAGKDVNGSQVITSLELYFPDGKKIPQGGITAKTLREISFHEFLVTHFEEESELKLTTIHRNKLLKFVKNGEEFSGRSGFSKEFYAALSYFYVETFEKNPKEPTAQLVEMLDLPRRTVVNRLATARRLGLLTQQSLYRPSGKAGGSLTKESLELIGKYLNS